MHLTKVPKIDSHSTEMGNDVVVAVLQCEPGCLCGFRARQGHSLESPRHAKMDVHNFWCFCTPKEVKQIFAMNLNSCQGVLVYCFSPCATVCRVNPVIKLAMNSEACRLVDGQDILHLEPNLKTLKRKRADAPSVNRPFGDFATNRLPTKSFLCA